MRIVHTIQELRERIDHVRRRGQSVGLIPTMGYLHDGHMALVDAARRECDCVVTSIFVNPLQFGPNEDFASYPRDLERDASVLAAHGCDLLFAPSVSEMYPEPLQTAVMLPDMSQVLCGRTRPTHFRGVTTVVTKLFNIVQPDKAFFGQKDGQQVILIRRMVQDLNLPVSVMTVPTVREQDGLAKSSRNIYLTAAERPHANVLYRALSHAHHLLVQGERQADRLVSEMHSVIDRDGAAKLDYAEIVNLSNLAPVTLVEGQVMLAIAAYIGKARLIDNFQLEVTPTRVINLFESDVPVC